MSPLAILVVCAYASLVYECFVMRVPSVASTYELVQQGGAGRGGAKLLLVLSTTIAVGSFCLPLVLAFAPRLRAWLGPVALPAWTGVAYASAALIVLGRALTLSAVARLRRAVREPQVLSDGPFRFSRNPALLGLHLFFAGNCLAFPCVVLFAGFVYWCAHMDTRVRLEERFLSARFGGEYDAYRARVGRYF